jgi:Transposase IS200 like
MPEHVHILLDVDPQLGVHRVVKAIKARSSRLLRQEFSWLKSRLATLWTKQKAERCEPLEAPGFSHREHSPRVGPSRAPTILHITTFAADQF